MDDDIKALLTKLLEKLDGIETRITKLESESHKQITLDDYHKKYGATPVPFWPTPMPLQPDYQRFMGGDPFPGYDPLRGPIC